MATKSQLRHFAQTNNCSLSEAREHFRRLAAQPGNMKQAAAQAEQAKKVYGNLPDNYTSFNIVINGVSKGYHSFALPNDLPYVLGKDSKTLRDIKEMSKDTQESIPHQKQEVCHILASVSNITQSIASGLTVEYEHKVVFTMIAEVIRRAVEPVVGKFKSIDIQVTSLKSPAAMLGFSQGADPFITAFTEHDYIRVVDFDDRVVFEITTHDLVQPGDNGQAITERNVAKYLDRLFS